MTIRFCFILNVVFWAKVALKDSVVNYHLELWYQQKDKVVLLWSHSSPFLSSVNKHSKANSVWLLNFRKLCLLPEIDIMLCSHVGVWGWKAFLRAFLSEKAQHASVRAWPSDREIRQCFRLRSHTKRVLVRKVPTWNLLFIGALIRTKGGIAHYHVSWV